MVISPTRLQALIGVWEDCRMLDGLSRILRVVARRRGTATRGTTRDAVTVGTRAVGVPDELGALAKRDAG